MTARDGVRRVVWTALITGVALLPSAADAQPASSAGAALPSAFLAAAAAERAFARATAELGVRNGFLTFFADEAMTVDFPGGVATLARAKEGLRKQPEPAYPLSSVLEWEPRYGTASSDGRLAFLTGPFAAREVATGRELTRGAYSSVWKKHADGTWKVLVDLGVDVGPDGRMPASLSLVPPSAAGGTPGGSEPPASWDTHLSEAAAGKGVRAACEEAFSAVVRVHLEGVGARIGREDACATLDAQFSTLRLTPLAGEAASDLAFTLGGFEGSPRAGTASTGSYMAVWQRRGATWSVVFLVLSPQRQGA